MCCTHKNAEEAERLALINNSLESLSKKLDSLEKHMLQSNDFLEARTSRRRTTVLEGARASRNVSQVSFVFLL